MPERRRALMLVNPNARRGEQAMEVVPRLTELGLDVTVEQFASAEEVSADIVRCGPNADLVIVCGGDGTVASAALGVRETGLPMGILPLGTANDLARTLSLPLDLGEAAEVIARGRTKRIDLGLVNDKAFFNVASVGLSAELARRLSGAEKQRWGRLAYAAKALEVLSCAKPFRAMIESNGGKTPVRALQIAVGNGRYYGAGQVIAADAQIDDGRLDLYSLSPGAVWKLALLFAQFRGGRHGAWKEVLTAKCTDFWLRTEAPMPVNTDGDLLTETPAHFTVQPEAVEVFVP
ncbi:lipid kinase [Phenylobacterium sp.]|jgi:diacylglycerol kinase (ATP)|uniref:lipid kinase n=1 Tax=Phenylobacterium sp. TaxID=1871053 RepID=UPI003784DD01